MPCCNVWFSFSSRDTVFLSIGARTFSSRANSFAMPGEAKQIVRVRENQRQRLGPMGRWRAATLRMMRVLFDLHEYFRAGPALANWRAANRTILSRNLLASGENCSPVLENVVQWTYIESMLSVVHSLLEVLASSLELRPTEFSSGCRYEPCDMDTGNSIVTQALHELGTVNARELPDRATHRLRNHYPAEQRARYRRILQVQERERPLGLMPHIWQILT